MTTFVLVHGAWHGGWCWKRVAQILRKNGAEVFTPTLTGLGERSHLISADIGLETHIQDIAGVLEYEDLQDVILVAHSYGAMVISGVAETQTSRIKQLVYIDSFVPSDGQWMAQFFPSPAVADYKEKTLREGKGYGIPSPPPEMLGVTNQDDLDWVRPRLGLQPSKSFYDPIHLSNPAAVKIPHTYIYCKHLQSMVTQAANQIQADPNWHYLELEAGHDAMIVEPEKLATLLQNIAAKS